MMNKNEWKKVKLENVCDILDNKRIPITASKRKKGVYPYYGANGIQDYVDDYIFNDELILLAEDGGNFGSKTKPIAYRVSGKCWVNNHAHVLKAKENFMISDFLCYSLMFYDVTKIINGATRLKLTQSAMRNMLVPLPELREQEKIVKKLQCIEEILKKKKEQIKYLENLVKFQFLKIFGDPILNEKNWKTEKLFKVAPITQYIGKFDEKIWLLNLDMIEANTGKIIKYNYTNLENIPLSTYKFSEENVLYSKLRPYLNKVVIPNNRGYVTSEMLPLKPNPLLLNRYFFAYLLRCETFVDFIKNKVSGTKMPRVSMEELKQFDCILPPIELQNKFADFVKQVDKSKVELQKSIDETQLLFDSLMDKYFG